MYKVRIKTKYNVIEFITDDVNSPQIKEIIEQPYVLEVYIDSTNHYTQKELSHLLKL